MPTSHSFCMHLAIPIRCGVAYPVLKNTEYYFRLQVP